MYSCSPFHLMIMNCISEKKVCQKATDGGKELACPNCDKLFTTEKRLANHVGK